MGAIKNGWKRFRSLSTKAQVAGWVGALFVALILIAAISPEGTKDGSPDSEQPAAQAETGETVDEVSAAESETADATSTDGEPNEGEDSSPPPEESAPTPQEAVRDALGDEVSASGFAGDVEIKNVSFAEGEASVTAGTPEGGLQGPSCDDIDNGARAIFQKIYDDGGWSGQTVLVYQGGLVDTSTGAELPNTNTGIHTMPAEKAGQIDWSDEDVLFSINWEIYRDFCHPALR